MREDTAFYTGCMCFTWAEKAKLSLHITTTPRSQSPTSNPESPYGSLCGTCVSMSGLCVCSIGRCVVCDVCVHEVYAVCSMCCVCGQWCMVGRVSGHG